MYEKEYKKLLRQEKKLTRKIRKYRFLRIPKSIGKILSIAAPILLVAFVVLFLTNAASDSFRRIVLIGACVASIGSHVLCGLFSKVFAAAGFALLFPSFLSEDPIEMDIDMDMIENSETIRTLWLVTVVWRLIKLVFLFAFSLIVPILFVFSAYSTFEDRLERAEEQKAYVCGRIADYEKHREEYQTQERQEKEAALAKKNLEKEMEKESKLREASSFEIDYPYEMKNIVLPLLFRQSERY